MVFSEASAVLSSSQIRLRAIFVALALSLACLFTPTIKAQSQNDPEDNPVRLFERGQNAHEKQNFQLALDYYEKALRAYPEFPEAEFQKGATLVSLNRLTDAEKSFRRAIELREDWPLPYTALGLLLVQSKRESEAEPLLRRALELDAKNQNALAALADLRLRAGDAREAVELTKRATEDNKNASSNIWALRAAAERRAGDKAAAAKSLERAIALNPDEPTARAERAELYAEAKDFEHAVEDMRRALKSSPATMRVRLSLRLARFLLMADMRDEARRVLDELGPVPAEENRREADALRAELADSGENTAETRAALEKLLERDPRNASLLARLGSHYRTVNPERSLDYYRRAAEIDSTNVDYPIGFAAALVQARRFEQAAGILQKVIAVAPDKHEAHANLATALDELKRYREALAEYNWIREKRPELTITYFFIARAHDMLGEYREALAAYETFLAKADAKVNGLEIEKVKLRLPSLRNQIARGEGEKKRKKEDR